MSPFDRSIYEPDEWFLAFCGRDYTYAFDLFTRPGFRHVSAFAYLPFSNFWIFYDVHLFRTVIEFVPADAEADRRIEVLARAGPILRMKPGRDHRWMSHFGFYCVPAVKHLAGIRSSALTPRGLYRDCLRQGAQRAFER